MIIMEHINQYLANEDGYISRHIFNQTRHYLIGKTIIVYVRKTFLELALRYGRVSRY